MDESGIITQAKSPCQATNKHYLEYLKSLRPTGKVACNSKSNQTPPGWILESNCRLGRQDDKQSHPAAQE